MNRIYFLILFFVPFTLKAQQLDLFKSNSPLQFHLTIDMKDLLDPTVYDKEFKCLLEVRDTIQVENLKVKVEKRGKFRRNPDNCRIPSIAIFFQETENENSVFRNLGKVKLVERCGISKQYEYAVVKEYLCYQIFELFSHVSFGSRAVDMILSDNRKKRYSQISSKGFIIEPKKALKKRLQCIEVKEKNIPFEALDQEHLARFFLFQHLIGNSDWMIQDLHNVKILKNKEEDLFAVPYDFDLARVCNAPYLPKVLDKNMERKAYYGSKIDKQIIELVVNDFVAKQNLIIELIEKADLPDSEKVTFYKYFDLFYQDIQNPEFIQKMSD